MLPVSRTQFPATFVLPPAELLRWRLYWWPCSAASVCMDRARSRRKRGFISHLAVRPPPPYPLHGEGAWLMTAHSVLGAYLAITGSPGKACWGPGQILVLHIPAGVRAAMNRRPAGQTSVPREASVTHWNR